MIDKVFIYFRGIGILHTNPGCLDSGVHLLMRALMSAQNLNKRERRCRKGNWRNLFVVPVVVVDRTYLNLRFELLSYADAFCQCLHVIMSFNISAWNVS